MHRLFSTTFLVLLFAASAWAETLFTSPTGSGTSCTIGSPCTLAYAATIESPGDTICLTAGVDKTYSGKFSLNLDGSSGNHVVVRSCDATGSSQIIHEGDPGWATFDSYRTTTLNGGINNSVTTITLTSTAGLTVGMSLSIDDEIIQVGGISGNDITSVTRAWNGTLAASHSNGATVYHLGSALDMTGSTYFTLRDFEATNSWTVRDVVNDPNPISNWRNLAISSAITAPDTNYAYFINLILHDTQIGIFTGSSSTNTLIEGNVMYYNGVWASTESPAGQALYIKNASGFSRIYNNAFVNNITLDIQIRGDAGNPGADIQDNDSAVPGSLVGLPSYGFLLFSPDSTHLTPVIDGNVSYQRPTTTRTAYQLSGINFLTFTNNYVLGGGGNAGEISVSVNDSPGGATITGNKIYSSNEGWFIYLLVPAAATSVPYTINNNAYYNYDDDFTLYITTAKTWAQWQAAGFDAGGSQSSGAIPDFTLVRPNANETGRCRLVSYAPSSPASVNFNLSTCGLTHGQAFTAKNVFNYKGTAVATGTYNSGSPTISVSTSAGAVTAVATPSGTDWPEDAATTAPELLFLEVLPGEEEGEQQDDPSGNRGARLFFFAGMSVLAFALIVAGLIAFCIRRHEIRRLNAIAQPKYLNAGVNDFIDDFHRESRRDKDRV